MTRRATLVSWGAVLLGLSLSAGCKSQSERYPPPQPYPSGPGGAQIGGGAQGGGGAGGAQGGGGTGGATTTGTPTESNICECSFEMTDPGACSDCANNAISGACTAEVTDCNNDLICKDLLACKAQCQGQPAADKVTCVQGCYAGVDLSSPDNHAFVNVMACLCGACAGSCAPTMPIACP